MTSVLPFRFDLDQAAVFDRGRGTEVRPRLARGRADAPRLVEVKLRLPGKSVAFNHEPES